MRPAIDWDTTARLYEEAASAVTVQDYEKRVHEFSLGPPRVDWSVPEAFLAIVLSAVHSDANVSDEEKDQLKALRKRSRVLSALSPDQINRAHSRAQAKLQQRGDAGLREACECLPHMLRLPVFALALDLVLADGKLMQSEKDFIGKIAGWLQIDKGMEWQITHVMLMKNNC